ncbi:hypothetical protein [Dictyobacter arantiisoli]|uniref:Uncharacterized protein n=1 Tax=Dictyobacter arantiisoli TaxID=2014874 RepID=A0A5A5T8X5_9CHLR|nr:hypothetical protein [Dictyobacter arantiisoli]GCF07626.1 hypothetical protein KDI_11900 [Dictyobacter arantiisoli]
MPITRRRRVNPPEQPEQNNPVAERTEQAAGSAASENATETSQAVEGQGQTAPATAAPAPASTPHAPAFPAAQPPVTPVLNHERTDTAEPVAPAPTAPAPTPRSVRHERHEFTPTIESGRRTARGELFRRPPQAPVQQPVAPAASPAPLQPPSHEITLPLGNLLHLAYNPSYTGSSEARSTLLQKLASESKEGGRARCWSCGSLAITYDRWSTLSKSFGDVGVAVCEICGVWSVL